MFFPKVHVTIYTRIHSHKNEYCTIQKLKVPNKINVPNLESKFRKCHAKIINSHKWTFRKKSIFQKKIISCEVFFIRLSQFVFIALDFCWMLSNITNNSKKHVQNELFSSCLYTKNKPNVEKRSWCRPRLLFSASLWHRGLEEPVGVEFLGHGLSYSL